MEEAPEARLFAARAVRTPALLKQLRLSEQRRAEWEKPVRNGRQVKALEQERDEARAEAERAEAEAAAARLAMAAAATDRSAPESAEEEAEAAAAQAAAQAQAAARAAAAQAQAAAQVSWSSSCVSIVTVAEAIRTASRVSRVGLVRIVWLLRALTVKQCFDFGTPGAAGGAGAGAGGGARARRCAGAADERGGARAEGAGGEPRPKLHKGLLGTKGVIG
eukprot:1184972-Prorocentrum_minimum.AAC.2